MPRHMLDLTLGRALFGKITDSQNFARASLILNRMNREFKDALIIWKSGCGLDCFRARSTDGEPISRQQQSIRRNTDKRLSLLRMRSENRAFISTIPPSRTTASPSRVAFANPFKSVM